LFHRVDDVEHVIDGGLKLAVLVMETDDDFYARGWEMTFEGFLYLFYVSGDEVNHLGEGP
jgi:hypothetical protein